MAKKRIPLGAGHDIAFTQLLNAQSISANGQSPGVIGSGIGGSGFDYIFVEFSVTAVPVGGAPTLDLYLQTSCDGGTTWRDIAHAAQFTTAVVNTFAQISGLMTGAAAFLAASDAALAANSTVQGPFGDRLRVKWVFAAGGSAGPYTVSVNAVLK
jgi:hypothetical protein